MKEKQKETGRKNEGKVERNRQKNEGKVERNKQKK